MKKIKISSVSYLNSSPFIYGISQSDIKNEIELSLDIPSVCAQKLISHEVDIGLVPVTTLPELKDPHIITDYCISAQKKVNSVLLLSHVPLIEIKTILLDYQSRTSVELVKIICSKHWKIYPQFNNAYVGYEEDIQQNTSGLVIGDRALKIKNKFNYVYDLAEAWYEMTSLPFVFACWISNKKLDEYFIQKFNNALRYGVLNIDKVLAASMESEISLKEKKEYLENNISFTFTDEKKKGLKLFLEYLAIEKDNQKSALLKSGK